MPKKVIANLNIQVGASSATLRKDFKAGAGAVKGFARDVQGTAGRLRTFDAARDRAGRGLASFAGRAKSAALGLAGMVTAAAAAAISVRGVTGAFADLDRISKFSDAVGLSTETMAAWRHGAELTGTSTATLEKGVQRFARVLGDAQAGVGAAVRGFETLGLSVDELAKMNTAEAFKATAEAIKGIADPAQRAAAAYAVFGRQGQELMTFLTAGRDGIEAMEAEARTLGITFSREMGAKVEAANDAMARMGAATRGMAQQLAISLAPAIINVSEGLTSLAVYLGNVDLTTVKTALQIGAFAASLALVITIAPKIIAAIRGIIVALKAMTTASIIAQGVSGVGLAKVVVGLAAAGAVAYGVGRGFDQLTKETDAAANSTAKLGKQLQVALPEDLADPVDEAAEKMQKLAAENERWVSIGQRITASVATLAVIRWPIETQRSFSAANFCIFSAASSTGSARSSGRATCNCLPSLAVLLAAASVSLVSWSNPRPTPYATAPAAARPTTTFARPTPDTPWAIMLAVVIALRATIIPRMAAMIFGAIVITKAKLAANAPIWRAVFTVVRSTLPK